MRISGSDFAHGGQEETVRLLHNVGFVHGGDFLAEVLRGILEGKVGNLARGLVSDHFNALRDTGHDGVFETRVFTLSVLTNGHHVHIVVASALLNTGDAQARAHVGVELEGLTQRQVERAVTLADGCGERAC